MTSSTPSNEQSLAEMTLGAKISNDSSENDEGKGVFSPITIWEPEGASVSESDIFGPEYHRTARIAILAVMIVVSLFGNSLVCWRLIPLRRHRYPKAKILFLNLATADLFVTLIAMTSQMVWEVMGRLWIAGDTFCRVFKFLQTFSLASSTYVLVSIAADRHSAIARPMSRCPTPKSLAIGAWLASLIPSVPCIYVFREVKVSEGVSYCASLFYTGQFPLYYRQLYMAFVFLSIFIVPFLMLVGLYTRILIVIWTSAFTSGQQSSTSLPRAKIKTLKMTVVIFVMFIVTNLPYVVQEMILAFGDSSLLDPSTVALFGVISASNSAFNPYVYMAFQAKDTFFGRIMKLMSLFICCPRWKYTTQTSGIGSSPKPRRQSSFTSATSKTSTRVNTNGQLLCFQNQYPTKQKDLTIRIHNRTKTETFL